MKYYAYMLKSRDKKDITYVGWTNNLKKRIKIHNAGKGAKFTKGRKWKIMYYEKYTNRRKAMIREIYLKKNRKLRNQIKNKYR